MNRTELVKGVSDQEGIPANMVTQIVTSFLDLMALTLSAGDEVLLRDFGKFQPRERKASIRRNPKTGEKIAVPAKTSVGFIPSPSLKARLNK